MKTPPFTIQWHITNKCNLRCGHCYHEHYDDQQLSQMDIRKIVNEISLLLSSLKSPGHIVITGGEPFYDSELLFLAIDHLEQSGNVDSIGIMTNGTVMAASTLERLGKIKKLRDVQVSLDGAYAETHDKNRGVGSFKAAMHFISKLKQANGFVSAMYTISKQNISEVPEMITIAGKIKLNLLTFDRWLPLGQSANSTDKIVSKEAIKATFSAISEHTNEVNSKLFITTSRPLWCLAGKNGSICSAGLFNLCIINNGDVYPCRRLPLKIGNVFDDSLLKIWYTSSILWALRDRQNKAYACCDCEFLHQCGGCRAAAYAYNSDMLARDPHCWLGDK